MGKKKRRGGKRERERERWETLLTSFSFGGRFSGSAILPAKWEELSMDAGQETRGVFRSNCLTSLIIGQI
jgi:hypothetical protein